MISPSLAFFPSTRHSISGDPTTFGNLKPCNEITEALEKSLKSNNCNGYLPSTGTDEAKKAIADYCASNGENISVQVSKLANFLFS